MEKSTKPTPVIVIGIRNIAIELGVSPHMVRKTFLPRPGFPIRKSQDGGNAPWLTTREALTDWARDFVKQRGEMTP